MIDRGRCLIVAEAGVNHNGSFELAKRLVESAAESGADAVKFQTFHSEELVSRYAAKAEYQLSTTDKDESQLEMLKRLELSVEMHEHLIEYAKKCGIQFLSTPFDSLSASLLTETFDLPIIKISSGDLNNAPLLLQIARTGKPMIVSTGMATLGEIEEALGCIAFGYTKKDAEPSISAFRQAYASPEGRQALYQNVTLLHCTTEYPARFEEVNLRAMESLKQAFGVKVGLSDHTEGIVVPIAAVAVGARVIEKHFTLDKTLPGPDHKSSLEPHELKEMVASIRKVEDAMGTYVKYPTESEVKNMAVARKSLVARRPIRAGERFTEENLTVKRPGTGIPPKYYWEWLGRYAKRDYDTDEVIVDE